MALKNPSPWPGLNLRTLGLMASTLTITPSRRPAFALSAKLHWDCIRISATSNHLNKCTNKHRGSNYRHLVCPTTWIIQNERVYVCYSSVCLCLWPYISVGKAVISLSCHHTTRAPFGSHFITSICSLRQWLYTTWANCYNLHPSPLKWSVASSWFSFHTLEAANSNQEWEKPCCRHSLCQNSNADWTGREFILVSYLTPGVQFKTQTNNNTNIELEAGQPLYNITSRPPPWHSCHNHSGCQAAAYASCANAVQVWTWCNLFTNRTCVHIWALLRIEILCSCSWSIYQYVSWQGSIK
jgi:hypothetical protein